MTRRMQQPRKDVLRESLRTIPVERLREVFEVTASGSLIWRKAVSSHAKIGRVAGGPLGRAGYRVVGIDGQRLLEHRVVFAITNGRWPTAYVDHIDGDKTNNAPSNLREATSAQNQQNCPPRSSNKSGHTGVCWHRLTRKWRAGICISARSIHLGLFDRMEDAIKARVEAEARHFGEYRRVL